jgi:uncharacterized protein YecE (DUF72 family)
MEQPFLPFASPTPAFFSPNKEDRLFQFGTAGFSYKDWEGTVYPSPIPKSFNHMFFLSQRFDFIEINTSFYHIPPLKLVQGWLSKTESLPNYSFWVKLHHSLTHQRSFRTVDISFFLANLKPLIAGGKLTGLLAQFPYSFSFCQDHFHYVQELSKYFTSLPLALEFRHNSWQHDEVFDYLKSSQSIFVNIDQPVIASSLPLTAHCTHEQMAYFRLHGRNYHAWFANQGRDARYFYNYQLSELHEIAEKIKQLRAIARQIFISGNNHYKGHAVNNLLQLKKIISDNHHSAPNNPQIP